MQEAIDLASEVNDQEAEGSVAEWPAYSQGDDEERLDYFIERDGHRYAGTHLIIDLRGASRLDDLEVMEKALRDSIKAAKATLLHIHLHHFTPNGGISGVAVLAESHISVHTWPERNFAAFDIFMCGESEPAKAVPVLEAAFTPTEVNVEEILRGKVSIDDDDYLS